MLQSRIDRFVKRMPEDKIEFMGYIWPANLIQPDYNFNTLRHPTIMQCLEYVLGVDLFFCFDGLHKNGIDTEKLYMHLNCIKSYAETDRGKKMAVESIEKYTAQNMEDDFLGVYDIAFKIYDDIVKDIYIGILPAGKDNTIPRTDFFNWLRLYIEPDRAQNKNTTDVNSFIVEMGAQVKNLYSKTVSEVKKGTIRTALDLTIADMNEYYAGNKQKFPDITEADITAAKSQFGGAQQARDVKGAILLSMVENRFPKIRNENTFPTNLQKMWPHYTTLKKSQK